MNKLLEQMTFPDTSAKLSSQEEELLNKININGHVTISTKKSKTEANLIPEILLPNFEENLALITKLEEKGFLLHFFFGEKIYYYNPDFCKIITLRVKFPQIRLGKNHHTGIISAENDNEIQKSKYFKYILENVFSQNKKENLLFLTRIYYERECGIVSIPHILKEEIIKKLENGKFIYQILTPEEKQYRCNVCNEKFTSILEVDILKCPQCGNLVS